jgi:hypothetical protein
LLVVVAVVEPLGLPQLGVVVAVLVVIAHPYLAHHLVVVGQQNRH